MASFSLISTGVLWMVRPIAIMLLFFSIAYPAKDLCVSIKMCQHQNATNRKCARQQQSTTVCPDMHMQIARQVAVSLNKLVQRAHCLLYY